MSDLVENVAPRESQSCESGLYASLYQPPSSPWNRLRHTADGQLTSDGTPGTAAVSPVALANGLPAADVGQRTAAPASADTPSSALLAVAAEFSPRYEQHRADLVSIDVRGLSRLLGTPRVIGGEMRREAASRGIRVHVAVAPTRMAALVLSLARPGLTVAPSGGVSALLANVPLTVLEQLHEDQVPAGGSKQIRLLADEARAAVTTLKRWGLRTLGELAALPSADLSARLGRSGRIWQAIARGEDIRPLVPMQPDERFQETLELEWPIEGAEPLSFVLTRLLEPLSTRLERRDRGAAVLHVTLGLVTRETHACRLELPSPLRDVRALRTLALLDFETRPPSAAIDTVTVTIEPTPGRILQHTLFTRPQPTPEQLSTLLARLAALMGHDRVGAPAMVDSYRPGAFAMTAFALDHSALPAHGTVHKPMPPGNNLPAMTGPSDDLLTVPSSALRRCRQPIPARVTTDAQHRPLRVSADRRGYVGGMVVSCAGPWRTSGAWWENEMTRASQNHSATPQTSAVASQRPRVVSQAGDVQAPGDARDASGPGAPSGRGVAPGQGAVSPDTPVPNSLRKENGGRGPWSRDEWDVALSDGAVYRIFRDRVTDGWFIDGVID